MDPAVERFLQEASCDTCTGPCTEFFSRVNIDRLHARIIAAVSEKLGYALERQSEQQLLILMRSFWVRYGRTLGPAGASDQVVAEAVKIIQVNIEMRERATKFLYQSPEPLDWGVSTNLRGTRMS
jgi:hypothetical protein